MGTAVAHLVGQWTLDRYFAGAVGPRGHRRLRGHLDGCARCRDRYQRHLLAEALLPDGDRLQEDRLWRTIRAGAAPVSRRPLVLAALVVATALVLLVPRRHDPVERGSGAGALAGPAIHLFRVDGPGRAAPVDGKIRAGDGLVLAYSNPGNLYDRLMVFAVDEAYHVHWFYPAYQRPDEDPQAVAIVRGRSGVELGEEIRHPFAPGKLRVYALFLDGPERVSHVEAVIGEALARSHVPLDREAPLPLPGEQRSQLLEVTP
jgi:hypothetical protein